MWSLRPQYVLPAISYIRLWQDSFKALLLFKVSCTLTKCQRLFLSLILKKSICACNQRCNWQYYYEEWNLASFIKSNQFDWSNEQQERPSGVVCEKGHGGVSFYVGVVCIANWLCGEVGFMGTSGNSESQLASRSTLTDLPDNALAISAGSLVFQSLLETAGTASLLVELKGVVA